jgi:hypothetical protein
MDVYWVSGPVTRKPIGCPDNLTPWVSPGIRTTAFRLIAILHDLMLGDLTLGQTQRSTQHRPLHRESRESDRKLLQNTCEQLAAIHADDPHL